MPWYHFVIHKHDDPLGVILPGPRAVREDGHRIVRELKDGSHDPPSLTLHVEDLQLDADS